MHPLRGASLRSAPLSSRQKGHRRVPREAQERPQRDAKRPQNGSQDKLLKARQSDPERLQRTPQRDSKRSYKIKQFAAKASESTPERPREAPERPPEGPQRGPREAPERPQKRHPESHREGMFRDLRRTQNVWFSIGFTTKTKTCLT